MMLLKIEMRRDRDIKEMEVDGMKRILRLDDVFEIFVNLAVVAVIVATMIAKIGS